MMKLSRSFAGEDIAARRSIPSGRMRPGTGRVGSLTTLAMLGISCDASGDCDMASGLRFREWFTWFAMPCPNSALEARGVDGSGRFGDGDAEGRGRGFRRVAAPPLGRDVGAGAGNGRRGSDSMIRMSSSRRFGGRRVAGGSVVDHRIVGSRDTGSDRRSTGRDGTGGTPGLGPGGPGGRFARGGSGDASRLNSEVSAQIARNVKGTMN